MLSPAKQIHIASHTFLKSNLRICCKALYTVVKNCKEWKERHLLHNSTQGHLSSVISEKEEEVKGAVRQIKMTASLV